MPEGRPETPLKAPRAIPGPRPQVWLVEDNLLEAQRTQVLLAARFEVTHFAEATAMLERLGVEAAPDLLLLDWQLPVVSGLEACHVVRELYDEVALPVLMLTVRGAREDIREGLAAGCNDYVAKPYDDAELLARVHTLVRGRRAVVEARRAQQLAEGALQEVREAHAQLEESHTQLQAARLERDVERERLLAVLEHAPVAIVLVDTAGRIVLANRRAETELRQPMAAIRTAEDLRQWTALGADGQPLPLEEYPVMRGLRGLSATAQELACRFPDGSEGTLEASYGPVRDAQGHIIASVVVFGDVSARKRAEQGLRESADFERQLIGIVSHDLRNPLAAIAMSAATLLRRPELDARQRPPIARILSSADRATRMIRDLLDFTQARLGAGLTLHRAPLDLHALARQVVEELLLAYPEREVQLQLQGEGRGAWDGDRLSQLLGNLLGNALAYSPAGTPVRVGVSGEGAELLLEVHNGGEPIAPELLLRLFQPFERGEHQVNRAGRSIGLGLFIVQGIARAHGGSVEVQSTQEAGTLFRVRLPRGP